MSKFNYYMIATQNNAYQVYKQNLKISTKELYNLQYRQDRIDNFLAPNTKPLQRTTINIWNKKKHLNACVNAKLSLVNRDNIDYYSIKLVERRKQYDSMLKFIQLSLPFIFLDEEQ